MADDQEQVVKQQGEIETPDSGATTEEPKTTAEVSEQVAETQDTQATGDLTEAEVSSLSERAQKRFRELADKAKRAEQLEEQIKSSREDEQSKFTSSLTPEQAYQPPAQLPTSGLPWEQSQTNPTEITQEDYKRDVTMTADAIAQARAADVEFRLRKESEIKDDYQKVASSYKELDPESGEFQPELSKKLAQLFQTQLRSDPKARLYDLVKTVMDVRKSGMEKGKSEVTAKLVRQTAEEAITPSAETGVSAENPEDIFKDPHRVKEQEELLKKQGLWE